MSPINGNILTSALADWAYIAVTIDLTANTLTQYQYDNGGSMVGAPLTQAITGNAWGVTNAGSYITLYGGSSMMFDEFSIDNYVLTEAELNRRVINMVKGYEIDDVVPPEGTMFMFK